MSSNKNDLSNALSPTQGYIDDIDFDHFTIGSLESTFHLENPPARFNELNSPYKRDSEILKIPEDKPLSSFRVPEISEDEINGQDFKSSQSNLSPRIRSHTLFNSSSAELDSDSRKSLPFESRHFTSLAKHARTLSAAMALKDKNGTKNGIVCLREQEKRADELSKENFSLKLKIYHLEERLTKVSPDYKDEVFKENLAYKAQVRESISEVKRYRAQLLEARNFIEGMKKRERESSKCSLPHGMTPEQDKEFQLQVKKANKYRKQFKKLKSDFVQQENDINEMKSLLIHVSENKQQDYLTPQLNGDHFEELNNKILTLQKELEFYKNLNFDCNQSPISRAESRNNSSTRRLSFQPTANGFSPCSTLDEVTELRQMISILKQDNAHLENTQLDLIETVNLYQEEISELKQQFYEPFCSKRSESEFHLSSTSAKESQQAILVETLRDQLQEAHKHMEKQDSLIQLYSEKNDFNLHSEIPPSHNSISQDLSSAQHFCSQGRNDKALSYMNQLQGHFQQLEVFISELIDRLRYSTVIESFDKRNKMIMEEIQKLETFCFTKFPEVLKVVSLQEKIRVLDDQLMEIEKLNESSRRENNDNETLLLNLKERDDLLYDVYSLLLKHSTASKLDFNSFEDFKEVLLTVVSNIDSNSNEYLLEKILAIQTDCQHNLNFFNQEIDDKSKRLSSAFEKIDNLLLRYNDLKEKALILKSRFGKAKACNEGYLSRIRELERVLDSIPAEEPNRIVDTSNLLSGLNTGLLEEKRKNLDLRRKYELQSSRAQTQVQNLASLLNRTIKTLVLVGNRTPQIEGLINDLQDATTISSV